MSPAAPTPPSRRSRCLVFVDIAVAPTVSVVSPPPQYRCLAVVVAPIPHRRVALGAVTIASPPPTHPAPLTSRPRLSTSPPAPPPPLSHRDLAPASCCRPAAAVRRWVSCRLGGPSMSSCPRRFGLASSSVVGRLRCWLLFGSGCRRWSVSPAGRFSLPVARRVVAAGSVSLVVSWIASGVLSISWWSDVDLRARVVSRSPSVLRVRLSRYLAVVAVSLRRRDWSWLFPSPLLVVVACLSSAPVHRLIPPVSCAALRGFYPLSYL